MRKEVKAKRLVRNRFDQRWLAYSKNSKCHLHWLNGTISVDPNGEKIFKRGNLPMCSRATNWPVGSCQLDILREWSQCVVEHPGVSAIVCINKLRVYGQIMLYLVHSTSLYVHNTL